MRNQNKFLKKENAQLGELNSILNGMFASS